jgi:4-hydroxybenzoate polyprenyltransferase
MVTVSTSNPMATFFARVRMTLDMIKFEHSVFALPFALTGAMLAWRDAAFVSDGIGVKLAWIVLAMVAARSAAMAFNRLLDAEIDARNPRTSSRHIPSGLLSRQFAWGFTIIASIAFVAASAALNPLCLKLSPVALGIVFFYSFTKRFTSLSHLVLGFSLGIAPAAAWIAIRATLDSRILWLTAAVSLWTAGFDMIHSCQDYDFDRRSGLHSIPRRFGIAGALWMARVMHAGMIVCLALLIISFGLSWPSWAGLALVAALLIYEHSLVKADDLTRVNAAFFTVNGWVSMLFFLFWAADILFLQRA